MIRSFCLFAVTLQGCFGPPALNAIKAGQAAYGAAQSINGAAGTYDAVLAQQKKHDERKRLEERLHAITHGQKDPYPESAGGCAGEAVGEEETVVAAYVPPAANSDMCKVPDIEPPKNPKAAKIDHLGAAGIAWGCSVDDTRALLGQRWELIQEWDLENDAGDHAQRYAGEFGGMRADTIDAVFIDGKLTSIAVEFPSNDEMSATKRWQMLFDKLSLQYGAPTKAELPKKSWHDKSHVFLDTAVKLGEWQPVARWTFKNDVAIVVAVVPSQPDDKGDRTLTPSLMFLTPKAIGVVKKRGAKNRDL